MAPLAYFITFRTYGSWLHGDERGTMDPANAVYGEERLPRDDFRRRAMAASLKNETPMLTADRRTVVEAAIRKVCETKEWELHALNVRTNHVHVVVSALDKPEQVLRTFKSWATRRLRESGLSGKDDALWSRHGSTVHLWDAKDVEGACAYVIEGQGADLTGR